MKPNLLPCPVLASNNGTIRERCATCPNRANSELVEASIKINDWLISMEAVKSVIDIPDVVYAPWAKAVKKAGAI